MNAPDIRSAVIAVIKSIAPEFEEAELDPAKPLREQIDLDSMDWLNVIVAFTAGAACLIVAAQAGNLYGDLLRQDFIGCQIAQSRLVRI